MYVCRLGALDALCHALRVTLGAFPFVGLFGSQVTSGILYMRQTVDANVLRLHAACYLLVCLQYAFLFALTLERYPGIVQWFGCLSQMPNTRFEPQLSVA